MITLMVLALVIAMLCGGEPPFQSWLERHDAQRHAND